MVSLINYLKLATPIIHNVYLVITPMGLLFRIFNRKKLQTQRGNTIKMKKN